MRSSSRIRRRVGTVLAARATVAATALSGTVLAGVVGTGPAAADPLPVPDSFFSGIPNELLDPGGSLPGSNDWSCRPSAEHPDPVVLVHGTGGGQQTNWGPVVPLLANEGYCVFAPTYGAHPGSPWPIAAVGGMQRMEDSAAQVGAFVRRVLAATGAERVDIVGHSQGTVVPNYWIKRLDGAGSVDKYVSLAPLWQGTDPGGAAAAHGADAISAPAARAGLDAWCGACFQMSPGSEFLTALNADGVYAPGVTYTNIATRYDEAVQPYTSGLVPGPGVTNIVVQDGCEIDYGEHAAIVADPRAHAYILTALDPAHPKPVPCEVVLPFTS